MGRFLRKCCIVIMHTNYKNTSCLNCYNFRTLNRYNFRTVNAIDFLFSALYTTPFLYVKIYFVSCNKTMLTL